jgi:hypothetical protein
VYLIVSLPAFGPISLPESDPVNNFSRTFMLNGSCPAK